MLHLFEEGPALEIFKEIRFECLRFRYHLRRLVVLDQISKSHRRGDFDL